MKVSDAPLTSQTHGPPNCRPVSSLAVVVFLETMSRIIGDSDMLGVICALEDVAVVHDTIALRLAPNAGSLRTIFSQSEEIGGGGESEF
jgi:hypothetical protein